jgi:hypothetical protein
MKPVLKYALRGLNVGIWSLLLTAIVIIFNLVMNEIAMYSGLIPYLNAVYKDVVLERIIPNAEFTAVTILKYYWHWALLVLLLPLLIGCIIGLTRKQDTKRCEPSGKE